MEVVIIVLSAINSIALWALAYFMYKNLKKNPEPAVIKQKLKPRAVGGKRKPVYIDETEAWAKERRELESRPPA